MSVPGPADEGTAKVSHLVTLGLPVYNAMPYLPETIESILAQTSDAFDVLIINDGSTDGSRAYLDSLPPDRFRIVHQENRGLTATLNRMLQETTTPWLARLDADDISLPNRIATVLDYIARYPDAGMFYSNARYYPDTSVGRFRCTVGSPESLRGITESGYILSICHPSVVLNVQKTLALGGYRFDLHVEDVDLWWRMALRYDIRFMPEDLVGFRQNSDSVSSRNLRQQAVNMHWIQYLLLSNLWGKQPKPYEQVIPVLDRFLKASSFRAKEHLRQINLSIASKHYVSAAIAAARAFAASPRYFLDRVAGEFGRAQVMKHGANPELHKSLAAELWD